MREIPARRKAPKRADGSTTPAQRRNTTATIAQPQPVDTTDVNETTPADEHDHQSAVQHQELDLVSPPDGNKQRSWAACVADATQDPYAAAWIIGLNGRKPPYPEPSSYGGKDSEWRRLADDFLRRTPDGTLIPKWPSGAR